ncbi:MAG: FHA domain-containing protein [Pirellulaceae bacterium]
MPRLVLIDQPNASAIEIPEGESTLGRRPDNSIVVAGETVSGHHARIVCSDGSCIIQDVGSTNGTLINGLEFSGTGQLKHNDLLHLGKTLLRYESGMTARGRSTPNDLLAAGRRQPLGGEEASATNLGTIMHDNPADITGVSTGGRFGALSANSEKKLRAMIEIGQRLRGAHQIAEILPAILESLFEVFSQADRGCILLRDEQGQLVPKAVNIEIPTPIRRSSSADHCQSRAGEQVGCAFGRHRQ